MKTIRLSSITLLLGLTGFAGLSTGLTAEEETGPIFYRSPKGTYRIQLVKDEEEPFIVSTRNPAERAALPGAAAEGDRSECQVRFYSSPNENWIFYAEHWRHHGVCAQELYHQESGVKFAPFKGKEWFAKTARNYAMKNGGFKMTDFLEKRSANSYENHLETRFRGWSFDSSRLLFAIYGEGAKQEPFYLYFNTRTKTLELTPYLRELNKTAARLAPNSRIDGVCAEPIDAPPSEADLKARFSALDEKLNKILAERVAEMNTEEADELRKLQQEWIKIRDEGVKTYLRFAPKGVEERRRLQFLFDVTTARLEEFNQATNDELLL